MLFSDDLLLIQMFKMELNVQSRQKSEEAVVSFPSTVLMPLHNHNTCHAVASTAELMVVCKCSCE